MSISPGTGEGAQSPAPDALEARLQRIEDSLARIERAVGRAAALVEPVAHDGPALVATLVDTADEIMMNAAARGLDVDGALHNGARLLGELIRIGSSPALERFLSSGLLSPESLGAMTALGQAFRATAGEPAGRAGFLALLKAGRDLEVQRALDFAIRFLRRSGELAAAAGEQHGSDVAAALPAGSRPLVAGATAHQEQDHE